MTKEQAKIIYDNWKVNIEVFDKILCVFDVVPESFFPYNTKILEEALNIVAKDYYDMGNKKMAENIKETMTYQMGGLWLIGEDSPGRKITDEEVLSHMKKNLDYIFANPELKRTTLQSLNEIRNSWAKLK